MINKENSYVRFTRLAEGSCLMLAGFAVLSLWSWAAGVSHLLTLQSPHKPVSPMTALSLGLFGAVIFFDGRFGQSIWMARVGKGLTGAVGAVAAFACCRPWFAWRSPWEEWLVSNSVQFGELPLGRMSPLTGALLLAGVVAYWLAQPAANNPIRGKAAAAIAVLISLIGMAHGFGQIMGWPTPQMPFSNPMALWTSLAFVALGGALLGNAGCRLAAASPVAASEPPKMPAWPPLSARLSTASVLMATVLTLAISTVTAIYLRQQRDQNRADARQLLNAIARLKLSQIANWRQERLNDARFFAQADFVAKDVQSFLAGPPSTQTRARMLRWMNLLKGGDRYSVVALLDTNSTVKLALPEPAESTMLASSMHGHLAPELELAREVMMSDLHLGASSNDIHIDLLVPVYSAPARSTNESESMTLIGRILLRLDPRQFLYPALRSWPTPSRTAETVLFRREGNEIVFLNELRHRTNSAFNFRIPIRAESTSPTMRATKGQLGQMEERDYRGVPVLAEVGQVPDSPWYLMAKVDLAELYAPLYRQAVITLALTAVLGLASSLLVILVNKRRQAQQVLQVLAAERRQLALAQRIEHLMKSANDAILLADGQDRIVEGNERLVQTYGYSLTELESMHLSQLRAPETRIGFAEQSVQLMTAGQAVFETLHQRKDGSVFPVEISSSVIEVDGRPYKLGIIRDVTERQAHEREIERLNRLYATLSAVNQSIVRVKSREELFREVCRIAVEFGGFKLAWIGWADAATRQVLPIARAGEPSEYLDQIRVFSDERPEGQGLVGLCLRTGQACVSNDLLADARVLPWHDIVATCNLRSSAALPVRYNGAVWGTFNVYAADPGVFQDREIALLEEMTVDISFAMEQLHQRELHQQAERALRDEEEMYRTLVGASPNAITVTDLAGRIIFASPIALQMFGEKSLADLTGRSVLEWVVPEEIERAQANIRQVSGQGQFLETEYTVVRKDGTRRNAEVTVGVFRANDGRPKGKIIITKDITERKQVEERLRKLQRAVEQCPALIVITDSAARIEYVNPKFTEVTGYSFAEVVGKNPRILKSGCTSAEEYRELWNIISCGGEWRGEFHNKKKNGDVFCEFSSISPILDETGRTTHYLAVSEDITERKRLEAQFRQSQKMEAVGQLAGGVAHDFNNILAAIMLHLGLLRDTPDLDPFLASSLSDLEGEARRASSLTRQLLQFSRRSVMQVQPLDLNEVVENLLKMLRRLIGEQITLEWQSWSGLPAVSGDIGMVEQVIMNLVVNARDAMPNGGRITIASEVMTLDDSQAQQNAESRAGTFVCLRVTDTGCGMDEVVLKRIFEPFFTTKEAGKGTGLGLATVYGIAKQHQGWVTAESSVAKGSTFRVLLPAMAVTAASTEAALPPEPPPRGDETVLLVEDEPSVRKNVANFLRKCGYQVLEAHSGPDALGCWAQHASKVDLLFTDMVMPGGLNGLQLVQKLRATKPGLKVIISSGYSEELVQQTDLAGMGISFLAKPCPPDNLAHAVRRCLDQPVLTPLNGLRNTSTRLSASPAAANALSVKR